MSGPARIFKYKMVDFVCFSQNNWEKRKARKQQFMLHLSRRDDVGRVLYIEPPLNFFRLILMPFSELKTAENRIRWQRALSLGKEDISENLFIFTPLFFIPFFNRLQFIYNINLIISLALIKKKIRKLGLKKIVLWLYQPFDYLLLRHFKDRILSIFDWAEKWDEFYICLPAWRRRAINAFEERVIKESDIVFTVSDRLLSKSRRINIRSYQVLDGATPELFGGNDFIPEDLASIKRPIIGYTGAVTEKTDIKLLEFISDNMPDASFVFIGQVHRRRVDISGLKKRNNIYFLGEKPYENLGPYIKNFDVCIIPNQTDNIFPPPTKVFDYLASGRPVISTHIPQEEWLKKYIKLAGTKKEFLDFLKKALGEHDAAMERSRISFAKNNSWKIRTEEIMNIIKKALH